MIKKVIAVLSFTLSCSTWAEERPTITENTYGDWGVQCNVQEGVNVCQALQVLWLEQNEEKKRLLTLQLVPSSDEKIVLQLSFPLGVDLRPGFVLAVDDNSEATFSYAMCANQNCMAFIIMDDDKLSAFKKGNVLKVGFRPFGSDKTVVLEASLKGFTKAVGNIGLNV